MEKDRPEPPEDTQSYRRECGDAWVLVVLVAAGIWLLVTMADLRKVQDCAARAPQLRNDWSS